MILFIRRFLFLSLLSGFGMFSFDANAQQVIFDGIDSDRVLPGHVIFKLQQEVIKGPEPPLHAPEAIMLALSGYTKSKAQRVFPNHYPPVIKYHPSGNPYSDLSRIYEVVIDKHDDIKSAMFDIAATGLVEYVQPRYLPETFPHHEVKLVLTGHVPNDSLLSLQYHLEKVQAFAAWSVWKGDTNTVIGITDTGVELLHPDLVNAIKYNYDDPINGEDSDGDGYIDNFYGWDLGEGDNDPSFNRSAHGVHVSGIAAAETNNFEGIAGAGYKSRFLPIKIDDQFGRLTKAYEGIVYAVDQGASVVNCSWGSFFNAGPFGQDIIDYAVLNHDVLVVAAAGNANVDIPFYPASFERVLSVAATDTLDTKTHFSNYGPYIDVSAPGVNILSTWVNGTYLSSGGTSMAAPIVAGATAILRSYYPDLDALQIKALLKMTADPIDMLEENSPYAQQLGYGRLNMFRALTETDHPYMTISSFHWDPEEGAAVRPGDSFSLAATFTNRLAPAEAIYAIAESNSPHIISVADSVWIGEMQTLELFNNLDNPFTFETLSSLPINHEAVILVRFFDNNLEQIGRKAFPVLLNRDFLNVSSGRISTTFSARGALGFNYPNLNQGLGLRYNDGYTMIKSAGLILGNDAFSVVDHVYGAQPGSFSTTLHPLQLPELHDDHPLAAVHVTGSITDIVDNHTAPLGVQVDYNAFFRDDNDKGDYLIIRYEITNQSDRIYHDLYAGFFADWVLRDAKHHRATINAIARLAYAYDETGGSYSGIQLLTSGGMRHYAFDNQGAHGSIRINNGFTDFQKYASLTNNRLNAGFFGNDNDVSSLLSHGPLTLYPGDATEVAFAIHVADHLEDMLLNMQKAAEWYLELLSYETGTGDEIASPGSQPLRVYPNPFSKEIRAETCASLFGVHQLQLLDVYGRILVNKHVMCKGMRQSYTIPTGNIPPGMYLIHLKGENISHAYPVIKTEMN